MQRVRQDLSALFGAMGPPAVSALVAYAAAALAYHAYPLAAKGGYAGMAGAALVICLPLFFLAYWLGAGMLGFGVDATRSCLPGAQRLRQRARFVASVLLLPALALPVAALCASPARRHWLPTVLGLALAPALALLAVAKRRRRIRQGSRPPSRALRRAERQKASRDRRPPVQIIRACLGGIFVQLSTRQVIIGLVLLALFFVAAVGLPWRGVSGARWAITPLTLIAAGLVATGFLAQISKLTRGQIAELALIPGLGAAAAQCRALCSAVLAPPLLWLGIVLLLGSAGLLLAGKPLSSVGVLALSMLGVWLTYTVLALQNLTTLPPKRQSFISEFWLLYIVAYAIYPFSAVRPLMQIVHLFWWAWIIFVLVALAIASAIGFSVRRLATAPHPFLA